KLIHNSLEAILQYTDVEVYKKPDVFTRNSKVRQELRIVDGSKLLQGFDLYNDFVFDQEIQAISAVQIHIPVYDTKWNLLFNDQTVGAQLKSKTCLVGRFQQAGTEARMHT